MRGVENAGLDAITRSPALRPHVDVVVVVAFLEGRLPLRVNVQKSAVASVWGYVADGRSFLGNRPGEVLRPGQPRRVDVHLARRIGDKRLPRIVRAFLNAG